MGYKSPEELDALHKLACSKVRCAASDTWKFVNRWYNTQIPSYREVFLDANKFYQDVYKSAFIDVYDEDSVSFGKNVNKFLNPVTFYFVVQLLEDALPEIDSTNEEDASVLSQLKELKKKVYDPYVDKRRNLQ